MALHFHRKPIIASANTLKNLVARYGEYTTKVDFLNIDEETYEKCRSTIALLQSSIKQIKEGSEDLQKRYEVITEEYRACKHKSERKDLMLEIEQIEEDSKYHTITADADELGFMLAARLDEAKCARDRMDVKLGYLTQKAQRALESQDRGTLNSPDEDSDRNSTSIPSNNRSADVAEARAPERANQPRTCRSVKPPQASLPKFYGSAEDFPEYWAVFETLVHNSSELDTMEKILLLKESLMGRAQNSIKGIRLVPENYEWLIETLKNNYSNQPVNRAQIVQKLVNMNPANDSAESCSTAFDHIQVLVHQMISAGYDVRKTCDPIWCETILAKFPQDVVKPVLIQGQSQDQQSIEDLMTSLKREISAKQYVECRLGHALGNIPNTACNVAADDSRPQSSDNCVFCRRSNHSSVACRTVTDQSRRRKILMDENRCWKCFSFDHNSFECRKGDCTRCGQQHHISLCVKKEVTTGQTNSWNPNRGHAREGTNHHNFRERNVRAHQPYESHHNSSGNPNSDRETSNDHNNQGNFSNLTHMRAESDLPSNSDQGQTSSQLVLMTAEGSIWNFRKGCYEKVLFFFDSGAQNTVIEERTADQFGIPRQATGSCTMSGMGGHVERFKSHAVTIKICSGFGEEMEMKIQTKPVITNGFPSIQLTSKDITFLKENNIWLASSKLRGEHQVPHILVGLDYYHDLVLRPGTDRTPSGLHIARTIFGPTLYGKGSLTTENTTPSVCYGMTAISEERKLFADDAYGGSSKKTKYSNLKVISENISKKWSKPRMLSNSGREITTAGNHNDSLSRQRALPMPKTRRKLEPSYTRSFKERGEKGHVLCNSAQHVLTYGPYNHQFIANNRHRYSSSYADTTRHMMLMCVRARNKGTSLSKPNLN